MTELPPGEPPANLRADAGLSVVGLPAQASFCRAVLSLPVRPDHVGDPRRPALHGGVLSSLIDTAGGVAAWSALGPNETVSTIDLRVDFLEPAGTGAPLRAEAELVRKGNRVCHVRVAVTQNGVLVAEGRGVYNIHRRSTSP